MSHTARDLADLVALVARLRAPDGCPWDRQQGLPEVRAYLLEEAHELAAALDDGDTAELMEELGDLLFQAAFVARLAEEQGAFRLADAIAAVHAKMVERHPHVFGAEKLPDAESVRRAWERRKLEGKRGDGSLLDGVPSSLPALLAAYRMSQKAAGVGFDWPEPEAVIAKIEEELAELRAALAAEDDRDAVREEVGDLLFTVANLARKLEIDPEAVLAAANAKFRRRFRRVEKHLHDADRRLEQASLEELETAWERAKKEV